MSKGYLALVLHAHLPFVRHPEKEHSIEENWLFEAITECYIPLIRVLNKLITDGVQFKITLSLSPTLISMFKDPLLQERYHRHLKILQELAQRELERTSNQPDFYPLALMYKKLFNEAQQTFEAYHRDLFSAFKGLQVSGQVEIITTTATHAYLPLIGFPREAAQAQINIAVDFYQEHFGKIPPGIWLPECGYGSGDDVLIGKKGILYFIVDTHGLLYASPRPRYAIYAPISCPESGVAVFGRDPESSRQVWSADEGYPGDLDYRDFYLDIGYDLNLQEFNLYFHPGGIRTGTGIKYYRIKGKYQQKQPYVPQWAQKKAFIHAKNFIFSRLKQVDYLSKFMDRPPLIVCPYDAELFGHWWFEGPQWLEFLLREAAMQKELELITPSDYLNNYRPQPATPCMSSWGEQGYHQVWLEKSNDWIYPHLHKIAQQMVFMAHRYENITKPSILQKRILNQTLREMLLAQSSDWAFIIKNGTAVNYARNRIWEHLNNFQKLYQLFDHKTFDSKDLQQLRQLELKNNIFPKIDYRYIKS